VNHVHSANAPDIGVALRSIREAVGDALLVGEAYLPTAQLGPYTETLDVVFAFEAMNAGADAERLKITIDAACRSGRLGWVLSNHDFTRFATRFGENFRAAVVLFLSLPGPVFMYEGDELGTPDGPGVDPPLDRNDRDRFRHPMAWDQSPTGGFTTGTPWLPPLDPEQRNVAGQTQDGDSVLALFRRLIRWRHQLGEGDSHSLRFNDSPPHTVVFERNGYRVALNLGEQPAQIARPGELLVEAHAGDGADPGRLPPGGAWVARA
jgi:alpha-glucosidase